MDYRVIGASDCPQKKHIRINDDGFSGNVLRYCCAGFRIVHFRIRIHEIQLTVNAAVLADPLHKDIQPQAFCEDVRLYGNRLLTVGGYLQRLRVKLLEERSCLVLQAVKRNERNKCI